MLYLNEDILREVFTDWLGDVITIVKFGWTCKWIHTSFEHLLNDGITFRSNLHELCPEAVLLWLVENNVLVTDIHLKFSLYEYKFNSTKFSSPDLKERLLLFCRNLKGFRADKLYWKKPFFFQFLSQCSNLVSFVFRYCVIPAPELLKVVKLLPGSLAQIDLEGCRELSSESVKGIFARCPYLNSISLACCTKLRTVDIIFICCAFAKSLTALDVSYCNEAINDTVLTCLRLNNAKLLTRLNISGCHNIHDEAVRALVLECTELRELGMLQCHNLCMETLLFAEAVISGRLEQQQQQQQQQQNQQQLNVARNEQRLVVFQPDQVVQSGLGIVQRVKPPIFGVLPTPQVHFEHSRTKRLFDYCLYVMHSGVKFLCREHWLYYVLCLASLFYDFTGVFAGLGYVMKCCGASKEFHVVGGFIGRVEKGSAAEIMLFSFAVFFRDSVVLWWIVEAYKLLVDIVQNL